MVCTLNPWCGEPAVVGAPPACARCPRLCASRRGVVNGAGPLDASVWVVAQNPGPREEIEGVPLVGWSGSRLREKLMPEAGLDPATVHYENIVRCRPPRTRTGDLPPTATEIAACRPYLEELLQAHHPRYIITLGNLPLRWFDPAKRVGLQHGRPFQHPAGYTVIPMYHPAAAAPNRRPDLARTMLEDWLRLGVLLREELTQVLGRYHEASEDEVVRYLTGVKEFAFDFETEKASNLWYQTFQARRAKPVGFSVATRGGEALYCRGVVQSIRRFLENPGVAVYAHNAPYEYIVAAQHGVHITNLHCTKLMAYVLREPSTHLKDLSWSLLGVKQTRYEEVDWSDAPAVAQYGAADADLTLRLAHILTTRLHEAGLWSLYEDVERPLIPVLSEVERGGLLLNPEPLRALAQRLAVRADVLQHKLTGLFGLRGYAVNLNSEAQLRRLLYGPPHPQLLVTGELRGRLQHDPGCTRAGCEGFACASNIRTGAQSKLRWFPPGLDWHVRVRTPQGEPATDLNTIRLYRHPVVAPLVELKSIQHCVENNVRRLPLLVQEDGRVHPAFRQAGDYEEKPGEATEGPATSRLSSRYPNFQNITHHGDTERPYVVLWARYIRQAVVAPPGFVLVKADLGQEEPRIGAYAAQDAGLLSELEHGDVYKPVAGWAFQKEPALVTKEERQIGKRMFMAWLNRAGPAGIRQSAYWLTHNEAQRVVRALQQKYQPVEAWHAALVRHLQETGYTETLFGHRIYRAAIWTAPGGAAYKHAVRACAPDVIQGTAAGIMKVWLRRVATRLAQFGSEARIVLTVHDELVVECRERLRGAVAEVLRAEVANIMPFNLPVEVTWGPNWAEQVALA